MLNKSYMSATGESLREWALWKTHARYGALDGEIPGAYFNGLVDGWTKRNEDENKRIAEGAAKWDALVRERQG